VQRHPPACANCGPGAGAGINEAGKKTQKHLNYLDEGHLPR
jgi:hypothetical protein